jgi:secreted trypsin-like serine protease
MLLTSSSSAIVLTSASLLHLANADLFEKRPQIIGGATAKSTRYPYTVGLTTTGEPARQFLAPQTPNII